MDSKKSIDNYLRFASRTRRDPQLSSTLRSYRNSHKVSTSVAQEVARWVVAQRKASRTAKQVLAHTRQYKRRISSSWHLDTKLSAYVSKVHQKFSCSCGSRLEVPAYNICKCGKIWNAYKIQSATKGDTMFVVREVPVRKNVLVSNRTTSRNRVSNFGEKFLKGEGWSSTDTGRTAWDSPSGNVTYFGHDGMAIVYDLDGQILEEVMIDNPDMTDPSSIVQQLKELEDSADPSPWYTRGGQGDGHPGDDADYMHPYFSKKRTRRTSDVLHEKAFSAFDEFLREQGLDPNGGASQGDIDRTIDSFEREYGGTFTPSNFDALKNTYMYHEGSRKRSQYEGFGQKHLAPQGWTSMDTARTDWDSPTGTVMFQGQTGDVSIFDLEAGGGLADSYNVGNMSEQEILEELLEAEELYKDGVQY